VAASPDGKQLVFVILGHRRNRRLPNDGACCSSVI
jgi:hypothetical protein